MSGGRPIRPRRALLFVPGTHADRFEKAVASGVDSVCIDLEDSVTEGKKNQARQNAVDYILSVAAAGTGAGGPELIVRINTPKSDAGLEDLEALERNGARPDAIILPKVGGPEAVRSVAERLDASFEEGTPVLLPLIETAAGLHRVEEIATASTGETALVAALLFGGFDLAAELGSSTEWEALLYARSRIVHSAALAGLPSMDMPDRDVRDTEGLARNASAARGLGFSGKMAIHPAQVPVIQDAFSPTDLEVERARRVVVAAEAGEADGQGVVLLDGHMVDLPVVRAARSTLAAHEAATSRTVGPQTGADS